MLNLYKSNKIEVISELLAEELKICPPPINEKLEIVVPNYFLGNWLREQITIKNKISALYELKTISTYTESLLTNFFPAIDMSAWNFESIKWGIIDSLEELNGFKEFSNIQQQRKQLLIDKKLSVNKVKEEISELLEAIEKNSNKVHETADVLYHLMVLLEANNIKIEDVMDELQKRQKKLYEIR